MIIACESEHVNVTDAFADQSLTAEQLTANPDYLGECSKMSYSEMFDIEVEDGTVNDCVKCEIVIDHGVAEFINVDEMATDSRKALKSTEARINTDTLEICQISQIDDILYNAMHEISKFDPCNDESLIHENKKSKIELQLNTMSDIFPKTDEPLSVPSPTTCVLKPRQTKAKTKYSDQAPEELSREKLICQKANTEESLRLDGSSKHSNEKKSETTNNSHLCPITSSQETLQEKPCNETTIQKEKAGVSENITYPIPSSQELQKETIHKDITRDDSDSSHEFRDGVLKGVLNKAQHVLKCNNELKANSDVKDAMTSKLNKKQSLQENNTVAVLGQKHNVTEGITGNNSCNGLNDRKDDKISKSNANDEFLKDKAQLRNETFLKSPKKLIYRQLHRSAPYHPSSTAQFPFSDCNLHTKYVQTSTLINEVNGSNLLDGIEVRNSKRNLLENRFRGQFEDIGVANLIPDHLGIDRNEVYNYVNNQLLQLSDCGQISGRASDGLIKGLMSTAVSAQMHLHIPPKSPSHSKSMPQNTINLPVIGIQQQGNRGPGLLNQTEVSKEGVHSRDNNIQELQTNGQMYEPARLYSNTEYDSTAKNSSHMSDFTNNSFETQPNIQIKEDPNLNLLQCESAGYAQSKILNNEIHPLSSPQKSYQKTLSVTGFHKLSCQQRFPHGQPRWANQDTTQQQFIYQRLIAHPSNMIHQPVVHNSNIQDFPNINSTSQRQMHPVSTVPVHSCKIYNTSYIQGSNPNPQNGNRTGIQSSDYDQIPRYHKGRESGTQYLGACNMYPNPSVCPNDTSNIENNRIPWAKRFATNSDKNCIKTYPCFPAPVSSEASYGNPNHMNSIHSLHTSSRNLSNAINSHPSMTNSVNTKHTCYLPSNGHSNRPVHPNSNNYTGNTTNSFKL